MKTFVRFFLTSSCLLPLAHAGLPPLTSLVDDDTAVILQVRNLAELRGNWEHSPVGRMAEDPDIIKLWQDVSKKFDGLSLEDICRESTGMSTNELLDTVKGEVLFTMSPPSVNKVDGVEGIEYPLLCLIDITGSEDKVLPLIDKSMQEFAEGGHRSTEETAGVTLHLETPAELQKAEDAGEHVSEGFTHPLVWTEHNGLLLMGDDKDALLRAVDGLEKNGVEHSMDRSDLYLQAVDHAGNPDLLLFVNWSSVYPLVRDSIRNSMQQDPASAGVNPMSVQPDMLLGALALDNIKSLFMGTAIKETKTTTDYGMTYGSDRGIVRLLAYEPGEVVKPKWIPANWINASSANFSIPTFWSELKGLVMRVNPMMGGMALGQLQQMKTSTGVDLEADVINSLGSHIISGYALPTPTSDVAKAPDFTQLDQVFVISLKDSAKLGAALNKYLSMLPPQATAMIQERDYLGYKLHVFSPPAMSPDQPQRNISYAVLDDWFILCMGGMTPLETLVQNIVNGRAESFWARDDVRSLLDAMPSDIVGLQLCDMSKVMPYLAQMASQFIKDPEGEPIKIDAALVGAFWSMMSSYGIKDSGGIYSHSEMEHVTK